MHYKSDLQTASTLFSVVAFGHLIIKSDQFIRGEIYVLLLSMPCVQRSKDIFSNYGFGFSLIIISFLVIFSDAGIFKR